MRRGLLSGLTGVLVGGLVFAAMSAGALGTTSAVAADGGSQDLGEVTVRAADYYAASPYGEEASEGAPLPDLEITVSQTKGLRAQGIEISWKGGKPSTVPNDQTGGENFFQIAQCWGDDPMFPGTPDRTTCQYGASGIAGGGRTSGLAVDAEVAERDLGYSVPAPDAITAGETAIPFRSTTTVNGRNEVVERIANGAYVSRATDVNNNQFFSKYTTNEVAWAGSGANGAGSAKFEVQTVVQSRALGCGRQVQGLDGTPVAQSCWLVFIPRGVADNGTSSITQSGLFWDSWQHNIAVRLDFRMVNSTCSIGASERQIVGSELLATAVSSWQPALCAGGGDIYNMITSTESDAVTAANFAIDSAPLALTTRAYAGEGADDLIYAPVGLSAITIGFAIDSEPSESATEEQKARAGLAFSSMNLTPRLIAKLLTNSYLDSLPTEGTSREHVAGNPRNIVYDPEFLDLNPDWANQVVAGIGVSDMLVPQGRSDVALALWNYVLADADARAFLDGTPDAWGTKVNKYSSTNAELNPAGAFPLPTDSFPKADPTKREAVAGGAGELNLVTWRPYTNDLDSSGNLALRGDAQVIDRWDALSSPPRYLVKPRALPSRQAVIALTDSAASEKYQLVTASLKNPAGSFVGATTASMTAAAAAMTVTGSQTQVKNFDATSDTARAAASAYPLTLPVYAAVNPYTSDADVRQSYATFIRYAAGFGQNEGLDLGQLPPGYAPLPDAWRAQSGIAASVIESGLKRSSAPAGTGTSTSSGPLASGAVPVPAAAAAAAAAPAVSAAAPAATDPVASGQVAGALAGAKTPDDPSTGGFGAVLPVSVLAGLVSAAAVLIIPRLPRRA